MKKLILFFCLTQFMVSAFAQNTVSLDTGLSGGVRYFEGRIRKETKLAVLNLRTSSPKLSEYVMEELTAYFVNSGSFIVVDRSNLELLQQEMAFQLSGEVSDETALSIGKKLGAQTIISGSVEIVGDILRLRIRAIAVESADIQGIYTANIQKDRFLTNLIGNTDNANADSGENIPNRNNPPPSQSGSSGGGVSLPDFMFSY
jgi:TolB-like protein